MNDLPQRFTALVARRPELAVRRTLDVPITLERGGRLWVWTSDKDGRTIDVCGMADAENAIFRRLCEAMPEGAGIHRALNNPTPRYYAYDDSDHRYSPASDPLSALFAFWEAQP